MNEYTDFFAGLSSEPARKPEPLEWSALRALSPKEMRRLWAIDEAWVELELLKFDVQRRFTPERRAEIQSRRDLTDEELELFGKYTMTRDLLLARQSAFWSPLKYEFRAYERFKVEFCMEAERATGKILLLGCGFNREQPEKDVIGSPNDEEIERLRRLFGEIAYD